MARTGKTGKKTRPEKAKAAVVALGKTKVRSGKADPFDILSKSVSDFTNNLLVIVPGLLHILSFFFLGIFVVLQFIILALLYPSEFLLTAEGDASAIFSPLIILFLFLDVIIVIVLEVYFKAAELGVIADVVSGRKTSFGRMLSHGKSLFSRVLGLFVATLAIVLVAAAVLLSIVLLINGLSGISPVISAIAFLLLYLLFLIAFTITILFSDPILIDRKFSGFFSGFTALIRTFNYAKANRGHVLITSAFCLCLWIIVLFISNLFGFPAILSDNEMWTLPHGSGTLETSLYYLVYSISSILNVLILYVGGTFLGLFVFNSYFSRNKINWK